MISELLTAPDSTELQQPCLESPACLHFVCVMIRPGSYKCSDCGIPIITEDLPSHIDQAKAIAVWNAEWVKRAEYYRR